LPNVGPYIYDVSISGFTRSSIYIYDISSLRVNSQFAAWWAVNDTDVDRSTIEEKKKPCFFWLY